MVDRKKRTSNTARGWQSEWVRRFVAGETPPALRDRLLERDRLKLETCPTCGHPVATIFDHLDGCDTPAQEARTGTPPNA